MRRATEPIPSDARHLGVTERYNLETAGLLRRRLPIVVGLFLLFVGIVTAAECVTRPERTVVILVFYGAELVACVAALVACRARLLWTHIIAPLLLAVLLLLMSAYNATVHGDLQRLVMGHLSLLGAVLVVLPWGWRAQLVVAGASVAAFVATTPFLNSVEPVVFPLVALLNGAVTSVLGALFLDRYRYDAFANAAAQQEEAAVAAALLHVAQTLSANADRGDTFEQVNQLAVEMLDCDWSSTFLWDQQHQVYHLHSNVGSRPEVRNELAELKFPRDSLPLLQALRPGVLIEVAGVEDQALIPPDFMRRMENASSIYVPICLGGGIIGVLAHGYFHRTGSFSVKQRRLALGIGNAVAVALENARLIADLQAASRLKTEFVSTMSHELRTPLNVILGFVEIARDAAFDAPERESCLLRIECAGRELLELVEGTLEIGRLEEGRDDVRIQPVSLPALWAALGETARAMPRQRAVTLQWAPAVPAVSLLTDPRKVAIVVRNLVGNALKFTDRGHVEAEASLEGQAVVVRVSDTGIGIAPENQSAIFEMFRQADQSDTRRHGGVGLGLYIVRRFVAQLGGSIELDSVPGRGSTFIVRLPHAAASWVDDRVDPARSIGASV